MTPPTAPSIASDLSRALDDEVRRIVGIKLVGWQVIGVVVALIAVGVMIAFALGSDGVAPKQFGDPGPRPLFVCGGGLALLAWATLERRLIARGVRWTMPVHIAIELTMPWWLLLFIAVAVDADHAKEAWGPFAIYAAVLLLSIVHLRLGLPIVTGIAGAIQYVVIQFVFIAPHSHHVDNYLPQGPEGPVGRAIMIVGAGVVAGFVARGMRAAFGGAARTVRARDLFGKYRLEAVIAQGGMGVVQRATYCPEGGFRRPVAVKLIHEHLARDPKFVDGFRNEAELCARLLHHNIVQVLDFGRVDDTYFIAMELVDGTTVRSIFKRVVAANARVPESVAAAIGQGILAGLHHAHHEALDDDGRPLHVIHRDLGLENILVAHSGVVKVTDFGIARALREAQSAETQTVVGHSDHMSPEQANAEALDERCDLFCVGILLWELVCGRPLFTKPTDAASLIAILTAKIAAPSTIDASLARWDSFFVKALARPKEERFSSANEMASALADVVDDADAADVARFIASLPAENADLAAADTMPIVGVTKATSDVVAIGSSSSSSSGSTATVRDAVRPEDVA